MIEEKINREIKKRKSIIIVVITIIAFFFIFWWIYPEFFSFHFHIKEKEMNPLKVYPNIMVFGIDISNSSEYIIISGSDIYLFDNHGSEIWIKSDFASRFTLFLNSENILTDFHDNSGIWNGYIIELDRKGNELWKFECGLIGYDAFKASNNGEYIAIGTTDKETGKKGFVHLLSKNGSLIWTKEFPMRVETIDISKDGDYIIVGTREEVIYLLNSQGEILWKKESHDASALNKARFSPNGEFVIFGIESNYIVCIDINGKELWKIETGQINRIKISEDSKYIVVGTNLGKLFYIDNKGIVIWQRNDYMIINDLDFSNDGKYIVVGAKGKLSLSDNYIAVYNVHGNLLWKYEVFDTIFAISMSPNGEYLVVGTRSSGLFFFDNFKAIEEYKKRSPETTIPPYIIEIIEV